MGKEEQKKKIKISVVTPEQKIFENMADFISIPAKSGSMGILPGHLPVIAQLKIGILKVVNDGKETYIGVCRGHFEYFGMLARVLTERAIITDYENRQQTLEELEKKHDITQEITEETRKVFNAIAGISKLRKQ